MHNDNLSLYTSDQISSDPRHLDHGKVIMTYFGDADNITTSDFRSRSAGIIAVTVTIFVFMTFD